MMDAQCDTFCTPQALETSLWRADMRGNRALMDATFTADFFEFGRSGRVWQRGDLRFDDCTPINIKLPLPNFKIAKLSDTTALITYDSAVRYDTLEHAHRSSVWSLMDGRWKLFFHQGTPFTPAGNQGA